MATPPATDSDVVGENRELPLHDTPPTGPTGPVRILVQTRTQFVPGKDKDYWERIGLMQNIICQHVWNRDYDGRRERARHRGCEFAYNNRDCWFLIDYPLTSVKLATEPPLIWYKWTGTSFIQLNEPPPPMVLEELRHYPFTKGPGTFTPPAEVSPHIRRKLLRDKLVRNMALAVDDVKFVREHPGDARWVKAKVDDKAWRRVAELVEWEERQESARSRGPGLEDAHM